MDKRTILFGKLMPKEPISEILVDRYHVVNRAFDQFPDRRGDIVSVGDTYVTLSTGEKLAVGD